MPSGIFALLADDPEWLSCILTHRPEVFSDAARESGSWHIVLHQDGDVLLRTHPGGRTDLERFLAFMRKTRTRVMIGDFDPPPGEPRAAEPATCRAMGWACTQLGETAGFAKVRSLIRDAMPPFISRTMTGSGESEHLFHLVLSFLNDAGKLTVADLPPVEIARGLRHMMLMLEQIYPTVGLEPPSVPLIVSNGTCLAGWSGPLGLPSTVFFRPPEVEDALHRGVGRSRQSGEIPLFPRNGRRAVLVSSFVDSPFTDSITGRVPAGSLFGVTRACEIETYDL